jgi:hypothetical protein
MSEQWQVSLFHLIQFQRPRRAKTTERVPLVPAETELRSSPKETALRI